MKRERALLVLAALAALVAVLIFIDRGRPTTDDKRRAGEQLFPGLDPARIDKIVLSRASGRVTLEKKNGGWWSEGRRADDATVEPILSTLAFGQVERRVEAGVRDKTGVDSPRVQLSATGELPAIDLRIGADAPGRGVYVLRGGDLLVAEHRLVEVTDLGPEAFRSRTPALDDPMGLNTLQVGALSIERRGAGWRIVAPKPALADPDRVAAMLNALFRARAQSVGSGPAPSPEPKDQPLIFDGKAQGRIRWDGCGKLSRVVRTDGAVLCFAADALAPLRMTVDQLREPHLASLRLDDVEAVDLNLAGRRLSLRHAAHAWRITAPTEAAAPGDDEAVRARLTELGKLRARAFGPPGPIPVGSLRLAGANDDVELTITRNERELTALRKGEDLALLLPGDAVKLFDADPLPLRSKRVDTFRPDQVTSVTSDGAVLPTSGPLVEALSDLHAERLQHREFTASHTLRVVAAGTPHTFYLGLRDPDGCLLRTSDGGPAFVIAPATCQVLFAPFDKK